MEHPSFIAALHARRATYGFPTDTPSPMATKIVAHRIWRLGEGSHANASFCRCSEAVFIARYNSITIAEPLRCTVTTKQGCYELDCWAIDDVIWIKNPKDKNWVKGVIYTYDKNAIIDCPAAQMLDNADTEGHRYKIEIVWSHKTEIALLREWSANAE